MARNESDREDLWAEATGLFPCWELTIPGDEEPVVVGFKSNGALSIYFNAELVYQFDAECRLRRGYEDGFLYRSEGMTLSRLQRRRSDEETNLLRTDLNAKELWEFLYRCRNNVASLHSKLGRNEYQVNRERGA